jgi:hypothetical protein
MKNKIFLFLISVAVGFASCERKIDEFKADANGVNFSQFVAVGNSLTAGYADGALFTSGQKNSIPNILSEQFKYAGGGNFNQPLMPTEDGVGFQAIPGGMYFYTKYVLKVVPDFNCDGTQAGTFSVKPAFIVDNPSQTALQQQLFAPPSNPGPYNNIGVPGASVQTLFYNRYGDPALDGHPFNPYFARFASSPSTTMIQDAIVQQPTFFYLWIGNNDVLTSALSGTDLLVTPVDTFSLYYNMAVTALLNSGKSPKGVLANIPDITSIPYFSTISQKLPYDNVILDSTQATGLNLLYSYFGHPNWGWKVGRNPFVIVTNSGEWKKMEPGDQFLLSLPTDSIKCKGMGVANPITLQPNPIPPQFVLEKSEIANLQAKVVAYNAIIAQAAQLNNLAFVDMNSYLKTFQSGIIYDGIKFNTQFITGGMFSTDGIHLNPRGCAVAANHFIKAINLKYGCSIPLTEITSRKGVIFP